LPELPEVEYARRQLQRAMAGAHITRVQTRRPNLRYPFQEDFARRLDGQLVLRVSRRAKYLLVELGSGDALLMHLGMSGSFRVLRAGREVSRRPYYYDVDRLEAHDHVVIELSNDAVVVFNDPRRFGFMTVLAPDEIETHAPVAKLGPEPLARAFDASVLAAALARRTTTLKLALLDQRVIAGLGNIYVSEALHRARLSPKRKASTLVMRSGAPRPEVAVLVDAIKETLRHAIANQHQTGADDRFLVYDREGQPCPRRGCPGTIRRIVQGGRSTFFCPVCQR
jgi:formamidopyrimidine-DNA glycosylase